MHDRVFNKTAGLVGGMLCMAGEESLADGGKPVRSRPGRLSEPTPETAPDAPADEIPLAESL